MFLSVPVLMKHNLQFVCIYLKKQLIHPDFVKFIQLFNKKKGKEQGFIILVNISLLVINF